ncbi:MAG: dihydrofolate reductase [Clostridia bacterium]|nr:dihydrofolate reductase [Clostridia bacterium]
MDIIVAVAKDWGLGKDNDLLFHIPEDMKYFRKMTKGSTVVMGRKTLESFPKGEPLPNRTNVVLTRSRDYEKEGVTVVHNFEELEALNLEEPVFVIGGASVYRNLLSKCRRAYITKIDAVKPADTFFPDLDENPDWELESESETFTFEGVDFKFTTYVKT